MLMLLRGSLKRSARAVQLFGRLAVLETHTPPPPCISYALVQATVGVGTVIIVYEILMTYEM